MPTIRALLENETVEHASYDTHKDFALTNEWELVRPLTTELQKEISTTDGFNKLILDLIEGRDLMKDEIKCLDRFQSRKVYTLSYSVIDFRSLRRAEIIKQMMEAESLEKFGEGSRYKFSRVELTNLTEALHKMGTYARLDASK